MLASELPRPEGTVNTSVPLLKAVAKLKGAPFFCYSFSHSTAQELELPTSLDAMRLMGSLLSPSIDDELDRLESFQRHAVDLLDRPLHTLIFENAFRLLYAAIERHVALPIVATTGDASLEPAVVFEWANISLHIRRDAFYVECWAGDELWERLYTGDLEENFETFLLESQETAAFPLKRRGHQ